MVTQTDAWKEVTEKNISNCWLIDNTAHDPDMVDNTAHDPSDTNGLLREIDSLSARLGIEDCLPAREYVAIDEGLATEDGRRHHHLVTGQQGDTITLLLDSRKTPSPCYWTTGC